MDQYTRSIARVVVAQIAQLVGFSGIQESANEALAEILLKYISEVGAAAHANAEIAGRALPNVLDVLMAFEDLGASVQDVMEYARTEEEVPFYHQLSAYPVHLYGRWKPSFKQLGETPPAHIPPFFPAFPDRHTYKETPLYVGHERDKLRQREKMFHKQKEGEEALLRQADRSQAAVAALQEDANEEGAGPATPLAKQLAEPLVKALVTARQPGSRAVNPFLAAPSWDNRTSLRDPSEPSSRSTEPHAEIGGTVEPFLKADLSGHKRALDQGAQVGAGLEEAAETVEWQEVKDGNKGGSLEAGPHAAFSFSWLSNTRLQALASTSHLGFEDAYAKAAEAEAEEAVAARKHKSKHRRRVEEDPALLRAQQLLAAGSDAMALEEEAQPPA
eukprot:jgi/Botrbrau1/4254/Bobra.0044s0049.1